MDLREDLLLMVHHYLIEVVVLRVRGMLLERSVRFNVTSLFVYSCLRVGFFFFFLIFFSPVV